MICITAHQQMQGKAGNPSCGTHLGSGAPSPDTIDLEDGRIRPLSAVENAASTHAAKKGLAQSFPGLDRVTQADLLQLNKHHMHTPQHRDLLLVLT